jgi:O-antigen/teichoic acid export membrane protein
MSETQADSQRADRSHGGVSAARIVGGVRWTAIQSWGIQGISLVTFAVLARLLPPSAFGLVAMVGLFNQIATVLVDQGLSTAVIQKKTLTDEQLSTAFWMSLGFATLLMAASMLLARPIAILFGEPSLTPVVRLTATNLVLVALSGVQDALLRRNFKFRLLAIRGLAAAAIGGAAAIGTAIAGWGALSLVIQQIAGSIAGVALLWRVTDWKPTFAFSRTDAKELSSFGLHVLGTRILGAISRRSDDMLIGYFLGATALGYYVIAYKIFKIIIEVFTKIISRVGLPVFAALQGQPAELSRMFSRTITASAALTFPCFAGLMIVAPDLLPRLFGDHWAAAVPVMQVLAIGGLLQALYPLAIQLMLGEGRPGWTFWLLVAGTVPNLIGFLFVVDRGIVAVATVFTVVTVLLLPVYVQMVRSLVPVTVGELLASIRIPAVATFVMGLGLLALERLVPHHVGSPTFLAVSIVIGVGLYVGVVHLQNRQLISQGLAFVRRPPRPARSLALEALPAEPLA